jgi:hypothetical protein
MSIDAVILMPDTNGIDLVREKNLTSDNMIKLKVILRYKHIIQHLEEIE